jgi:CPA1 family monovalent cation:H+ antiporter
MNSIVEVESLAIILLVVVSVVAVGANRLRIPYTVALVLVGLVLTFNQNLGAEITPELILALFIPPIAFEAALHLELDHLTNDLLQIGSLAIPGVIVITVIIGGMVTLLSPSIPLPTAMVFGALISATDPVAVVALFRSANISRRLSVILEAESLLNDGTAIVIFNIALAAAISGVFNPLGGISDFVRVSVGGVAIGGLLGWGVSRLLAQIDDYLVETTLTTCLAFGAYLLAEQLHTSGVLAVVTAGLFIGYLGRQGMSPTTRIVVTNFWEYMAFIANSLVFLLIGLSINVSEFTSYLGPIVVAIAAVLLSRAVVVYGLGLLLRGTRRAIPRPWQHVQFWGGLRGAVSLALALSLPAAITDRSTLRVMTFGVVLFTLLVQATTMPELLKRLRLFQASPRKLERDLRVGRLYAAQAAWRRLRQLNNQGIVTGEIWEGLRAQHRDERKRLDQEIHDLYFEFGELEREVLVSARRETLRAERVALNEALRQGLVTQEAYRKLIADVDKRLDAIAIIASEDGDDQ